MINRLFWRGQATGRGAIVPKKITRLEAEIELESDLHKSRLLNRNPRNLEQLSRDIKPEGFWLDKNPFVNWNRLVFGQKGKYLYASLIHWSGKTLVQASTKEQELLKYYKSPTTVQATSILAQVIARRCLQSGYLSVGVDTDSDLELKGPKTKTFFNMVKENGLVLEELPEIKPRSISDL